VSSLCAGIICACVSWTTPPPDPVIGPITVGIARDAADLPAALEWHAKRRREHPNAATIIHHLGECHGEPVS